MSPRAEDNLPKSITTERLADGIAFHLPPRQLGKGRLLGIPLIIGALVSVAFGIGFISMPFRAMQEPDQTFQWFLMIFVLVGCVPMFMSLGMAGIGLAVLTGSIRAEVEMRDGKLIAVERAGPLRWRRRRPTKAIEQIVFSRSLLRSAMTQRNAGNGDNPLVNQMATVNGASGLIARGENMKDMLIAPVYPAELLEPLAQVIAEKVQAKAPGRLFASSDEPRVKVVDEEAIKNRNPDEEDRLDRPAKSTIDIDTTTESDITFIARPLGFWRGCKFQAIFSVGWIAMSLLMSYGMFRDAWPKGGEDAWMAILFPLIFVSVGVGLFIGALNIGRRIVIIDIVGDTLLITRGSMFGAKVDELPIGDLKSIRVGPSNVEVNNKTLQQLQIRTRGGKDHKLLTYRKDPELEWLAQQLRLATGVKAI